MNDPIPDTELDPTTGQVVSVPATGTPVLLDKWSITKPDLHGSLSATLSAPERVSSGSSLTYTIHLSNHSHNALNGTQVRLSLASNVSLTHAPDGTTVLGNEAVVTIGRLAEGVSQDIQLTVTAAGRGEVDSVVTITSATALPLSTNHVETDVR